MLAARRSPTTEEDHDPSVPAHSRGGNHLLHRQPSRLLSKWAGRAALPTAKCSKDRQAKKRDAHCWCLHPAWQEVANPAIVTIVPYAYHHHTPEHVTFKLHIFNYYRINEATVPFVPSHCGHHSWPSPQSAKNTRPRRLSIYL